MESVPHTQALLQAFWLRPETALWRSLDIRAMAGFEMEEPSLDLGCGDGLFSFFRAGGCLDPLMDAFESMGNLESYFENVDAFDHFDAEFGLRVVQEPKYRITCALDHKRNLLLKTKPLGLYRRWVEADANQGLPFADGEFQSVFCNILYWLEQPAVALREIERVLGPGGHACLLVPNQRFLEGSFFLQQGGAAASPEYAFLSLLDRGRMAEIRQVHPASQWESFVEGAGLQVEQRVDLLSIPLVKIWDVGLRPLFRPLLKLARGLDREHLAPIKQDWVDTLQRFMDPILALDTELCAQGQATFHCYQLLKGPRS